jgi:hypothetical protein
VERGGGHALEWKVEGAVGGKGFRGEIAVADASTKSFWGSLFSFDDELMMVWRWWAAWADWNWVGQACQSL